MYSELQVLGTLSASKQQHVLPTASAGTRCNRRELVYRPRESEHFPYSF